MPPVKHGTRWTREELILAFNLYCQIPFGSIHSGNPRIVDLADMLGRSPHSISLRLSNYASHDPALRARGVRGMTGGGKEVAAIWAEFAHDPEALAFESESILASRLGRPLAEFAEIRPEDIPATLQGAEREALVRVRVNQQFFRKRILSAYDFRCCVTGLAVRDLLVASHIVPWAQDPANRLNPRNGLCLNALHDRAFDRGLMWIGESFTVHISPDILSLADADRMTREWMARFDGRPLLLPRHFAPDPALLRRHAERAMRAS